MPTPNPGRNIFKVCWYVVFCLVLTQTACGSALARTLVVGQAEIAPVLDGLGNDPAWVDSELLIVRDKVAKIDIRLRAVHSGGRIFMMVNFPDKEESRMHKCWVWDSGLKHYTMGNMREDVFIVKWNMEKYPVDLSIYAENPHIADVWYWKAQRTDPVGYADDKMHIFSPVQSREATPISTRNGNTMYLLRKEDEGEGAYRVNLYYEHAGDMLPRYVNKIPAGSRSDVRAIGKWRDGEWTIEFSRALITGHNDDVQFDLKGKYFFGVSRYEIAARKENPKLDQPLYGRGDIGEMLELIFN